MGSNCLKGSIRPQKILWEGVMFHLYLWEKYGTCYLIEVLVRPDLLLRKGGIVFLGRGDQRFEQELGSETFMEKLGRLCSHLYKRFSHEM